MRKWLISALVLAFGRGRREREAGSPPPRFHARARDELFVLALLGAAAICALAFAVVYFWNADTQLLGAAIGLALAFCGVAAAVAAKRLVPQTKELEERPQLGDPPAQEIVVEELERPGRGLTRKRLLVTAAGGTGAVVGGALLLPALSLGPAATGRLSHSPWRRGKRLVDEEDRPLTAADIGVGTFRTAFAEGSNKELLASPVVVVRLRESELDLPSERRDWAPEGILAFSKICTHAGCAVALFRYPTYREKSPRPALVCPCHYSTFDPSTGGERLFGPAGRALPQLPLAVDGDGNLVAAGGFSGRVGPSWWGVRRGS